MNSITLAEAMEQVGWDQQIDARSVYRACEHVEDKRQKRGRRYSVALILTLIRLGKTRRNDDIASDSRVGSLAGWMAPCGTAL